MLRLYTTEQLRSERIGRDHAAERLARARKACDEAANLPLEDQIPAGREVICAEAVAAEWGVPR